MIRVVGVAALLGGGVLTIHAQPGIGQNGVVNSASQIPTTLAGGAIARGARFTILGVRLGSSDRTTVTISQKGSGIAAHLLTVGDREIQGLMPPSAQLGEVSLIVTANGYASKPFRVRIVEANPGLYSDNGLGWGPGRIDQMGPKGDRSANSTAQPARPGQRVRLLATGLGNDREIKAVIGNRTVRVDRNQRRMEPGIEELTLRIPRDSPQGCYVPVFLQMSPGQASNVVTMAIGSRAGTCDAGPIPLLTAERVGVAVLSRTRTRTRKPEGPDSIRPEGPDSIRPEGSDSIRDDALVAFAVKSKEPVLSPLLLLPPPGTCTAYTSSFQSTSVLPGSISESLLAEVGGRGLDAGEKLDISTAGQTRTIPPVPGATGWYHTRLGSGGSEVNRRSLPLFLDADSSLSGHGGKDVGPFAIAVAAPSPVEWTDREQISVVDRSRGVQIHWRADQRDGIIVVLATNVDQISTAIGTCVCTARAMDNQLEIPAAMFYNLPPSLNVGGLPYDQLFVTSLPAKAQTKIDARGLTGATVVSLYATGRFVIYR